MNKEYEKIEPYQGFIRGNLFDDLYIPYKDYKPSDITPENEKEYNMLLIQIYQSAVHDLTLYLDIHPDDESAIKLRYDYMNMLKEAKEKYSESNYSLNLSCQNLNKSPWNWSTKKFPWQKNN